MCATRKNAKAAVDQTDALGPKAVSGIRPTGVHRHEIVGRRVVIVEAGLDSRHPVGLHVDIRLDGIQVTR